MNTLPLFGGEARVWSVADLTRYLREQLESDYRLQDLSVEGEVSNVSRPASGHMYFTLKDAEASLRCVMWKPDVLRQVVLPRDGDAIEVHGRISVYEAGGVYQLYADRIRVGGAGDLYAAFQRLKERLEAEGLFAPERKRPVPAWPSRIGIVTSPTGAALQDVLNTLRRRFPLAHAILAPTPVQGEAAPAGVIAALEALNQVSRPDVILLVRGGGSIEDLWAFNDEAVAHAIAGSEAPVISGVGHETDFTIADFVADLRAPTPTAAAELAVPDRETLLEGLHGARLWMSRNLDGRLRDLHWELDRQRSRLRLASPRARVANALQRVDDLSRRSWAAIRHDLALRASSVAGLEATLGAVGPPAVLARGYAVVTDAGGAVVRSVEGVAPGDSLQVRVEDGRMAAEVTSVEEDGGP